MQLTGFDLLKAIMIFTLEVKLRSAREISQELSERGGASLCKEYPITCKKKKTEFLLAVTHDWMMEVSRTSPQTLCSRVTALAKCNCSCKVDSLIAFSKSTPMHATFCLATVSK